MMDLVFRHIFADDSHIEIFVVSYIVFKWDSDNQADNSQIKNTGLDFSQIGFAAKFHFV